MAARIEKSVAFAGDAGIIIINYQKKELAAFGTRVLDHTRTWAAVLCEGVR
jgi:hypothetical protein